MATLNTSAFLSPTVNNVQYGAGITIEFWCFINNYTSNAVFFDATNSGLTNHLILQFYSNTNYLTLGGNGTFVTNGPVIALNTWKHVAVTISASGQVVWYLNGVQTATAVVAAVPAIIRQYTQFGSYQPTGNYIPDAKVSEFRVWNSDRTPSQILFNYNKRLDVNTTDCIFNITSNVLAALVPSNSAVCTNPYSITMSNYSSSKIVNDTALAALLVQPIFPLLLSTSSTPVATSGATTGTASVGVNGGVKPYFYLWSSGETTASITNKIAGVYSVTVTDSNSTTAVATTYVRETPMQVPVSATNTATNTGTATATPTGGTGVYSYVWTKNGVVIPSATSATLTGLTPAVYYCTVTSGTFVAGSAASVYTTALLITPTSTYMTVQWPSVAGASAYTVLYSSVSSTDGFKTFVTNFSGTTVTITNLTPLTTYYVRVQSRISGSYVTSYTGSTTLPSNATTNYSKAAIPITAGSAGKSATDVVYDVTHIQSIGAVTRDAVLKSLLNTGDKVIVKGRSVSNTATFVAPGSASTVSGNSHVFIPFEPTAGSQQISLTFPDKSTSVISYNTSANSVTIGGIERKIGDFFFLGGQRAQVLAK